MKNRKIYQLSLCALFTALIIIGAYIKIPVPPVPLTLQSFFVILSGLLLKRKYSAVSSLLYAVIGLIGFPVFAGGSGGLGCITTPTFGYVIGFIAGAFICGLITPRTKPTFPKLLGAAFSGMAAIYICGMLYYYLMQVLWLNATVDLKTFIVSFFLLSLPKDVVVCFISAMIAKRLSSVTISA